MPSGSSSVETIIDRDQRAQDEFQIQLEEPGDYDNVHAAETVSYFVIEAGRHVLEDGTVLEAGKLDLAGVGPWVGGQLVGSFADVPFATEYESTPFVFGQVQTFNERPGCPAATRIPCRLPSSRMESRDGHGECFHIRLATEQEEGQTELISSNHPDVTRSIFNLTAMRPDLWSVTTYA